MAVDGSPLEELIARAQLASERMSAKNSHRHLIKDMAVAIVSLARISADQSRIIAGYKEAAEQRRIVLP